MTYLSKILVCGMAKSGISAAKMLKRLGFDVTVQDLRDMNDKHIAETVKLIENEGLSMYLGKNPDEIVSQFEMIVVSPGIPCDLPFFKIAKKLGILVIGELELAYRYCKNPIAAITGTNGKTTTTALVGQIFSKFYNGSETVGNIGIPFTEKVLDMPVTGYVAAEVSSFQLETIDTFRPHIAAILNITPDHLSRHKTVENYAAVKERIFMNQTGNDFIVLNADDISCIEMAKQAKGKVVFFSRKKQMKGIVLINNEIWLTDNTFGKEEKIIDLSEIKIPGAHSIENVLAAAGIAICAKIPLPIIAESIRNFRGFEHRIEFVRELNGVKYYNDSKATNTDSAIKALEALSQPVILIGGGSDKGTGFDEWVKLFSGHVKKLILIGETTDNIIEVCNNNDFYEYTKASTLEEAVKICFETATLGDCVLLSPACASYDMFENFEHRGNLFKKYVNELNGVTDRS